jgi:hypothetical protein
MRLIFIAFAVLLLNFSLYSQMTHKVGLMIMIEDSLTHQYIGNSADKNFIQKYPATTDFRAFAIDTAIVILEENFGLWDFCTIDFDNFLLYEKNREELSAPNFRSFREDWFNQIKEKYEVDVVLVIRNSTNFTDGIHWSNTNLMGYGIYNGQTRLLNNAFIQLEFLLFLSGRPLTLIPGPIFKRDRTYPRIDKKDELFTETDLLMVEAPLKELIVNQIEAAMRDNNFMRGLR